MTKPHIALGHGVILSLLVTLLLLGCFVLRYHASTPSLTIFLPQHHSKKLGPLNDYVAFVSLASNDRRGWMLNPVIAAVRAGLTGGVKSCKSVHVGEIKPGGIRGNHRHLICNETFIIWGAKTIFRFEDGGSEKGYGEVLVGAEDVLVANSPQGRAHALANVDHIRSTYFLGCQDAILNSSNPDTEYRVWKDL
ncbi:hypothetical protein SUGI_0914560 [Cryptomeria japonica]|nr:hypothetical protein SUGI_0914560 [Cryptomeria japonica]